MVDKKKPKNRPDGTPDPMEAMRQQILGKMLPDVVFDGWTTQSLKKAALAAGMTTGELARGDLLLAFPNGIEDVLDFWSEIEDKKMLDAYLNAKPAPQRIRDKVTFLVKTRLEGLTENREAARRAAATLALPPYVGVGPKFTWRTADAIWCALGDTSTDYNYYTKRTILSGVYLSTLSQWFADEDGAREDPFAKTWAFLDDRIENVMQFEKLKGKVLKAIPDPTEMFGFLGKMRYGSGKE